MDNSREHKSAYDRFWDGAVTIILTLFCLLISIVELARSAGFEIGKLIAVWKFILG